MFLFFIIVRILLCVTPSGHALWYEPNVKNSEDSEAQRGGVHSKEAA